MFGLEATLAGLSEEERGHVCGHVRANCPLALG